LFKQLNTSRTIASGHRCFLFSATHSYCLLKFILFWCSQPPQTHRNKCLHTFRM